MSGAPADARRLAAEQAALRRVMVLVAQDAGQQRVLEAVADEACRLLAGHFTALLRFERDGRATVEAMAGAGVVRHALQVGMRLSGDGDGVVQRVRRTGQAARMDGYDGVPGPDAALARELGLTSGVGAPILSDGGVWGAITVLGAGPPLPDDAERRLEGFAELVAAALAGSQARADLRPLVDEQSALRRIAELTGREAPAEVVLEAVAVEASRLAGVEFGMVLRFEPDGSTEIMALDGAPPNFAVGMRAPAAGDSAARRVWRTRRATRIDDLAAMSGQWPRMAAQHGFTTSAGVPVLLQERLWGALVVVSRAAAMPAAIETHLTEFAELVSTGISAAHAREELRVVADEQAALRRVAELVARGAALEDVFAAVAAEASRLLVEMAAALLRFDPGATAVTVAACNSPAPVGLRIPSGAGTATGDVLRTGRPVRVDRFAGTPLGELARELGVGAGVAVPITVEGRVWGALTTSTDGLPLPAGTEERLAQFAGLAAAAIANAQNKAKLTASRRRVIATADETRRRLQRDLHDGAQQRLTHAIVTLGLVRQAVADGRPAASLVDEALQHAERASRDLRELVHGILPASLTHGGLPAGIASLVGDTPLDADVRVTVPRLPSQTETTAYFIVAEALANVVKHADATHASIDVAIHDHVLSIAVRDDGSGGAEPGRGSGLTGLLDRVEASAGTLTITSPPGGGTTLHATLPVAV